MIGAISAVSVRSRQSRRRDLGSGFAGEVEGCDLKLKSNSEVEGCEVEGLWALGSRFADEVEGCEVKGLWALGSISLWVRSLSLSLCVSLEMV